MPVSPKKSTGGTVSNQPSHIRPYLFHGVDLSVNGTHAVGDCPFCGRGGKFSVEVDTGLWRCWVCGAGTDSGGGNSLVFLRLTYENAAKNTSTGFHDQVAKDRGLTAFTTVASWGVALGTDNSWIVPGYGTDGKLDQLYRRVWSDGAWRLLPTPGVWPEGKVHALHMAAEEFDPTKPKIVVCEGPWDAMILWETYREEWGEANIVAVPGCNVWRDDWTQACRGKDVVLLYDSDHPHTIPGSSKASRAGYDGMARVAKRLSGTAASVKYMQWGQDGYNPHRPTGWDIRDEIKAADNRHEAIKGILARVVDAPHEWFSPASTPQNGHIGNGRNLETLPCSTWAECEKSWENAIRLRQDLRDAITVVLAICASTTQSGNQLFLDLIGSPGSAKTTICQGLLASEHCVHLENITKIISGWKKSGGEGDEDCSFLARSNNKTWVTCEFDVLGSSPEYHQLMGKIRRIFDGETSTTYGNMDTDRIYTALRTPWIRAGTHKMIDRMADYDQSQLGDRFLRFKINDPDHNERREIARSALKSERSAMIDRANNSAGSVVDAKTRLAHSLTGGYVDWLRANIEDKLPKVGISQEAEDYCIDLAELAADLRARPTESKRSIDSHDGKELPTRLARQNIRLASCLAVVLNQYSVGSDVLRIARKVALDTAHGHSLDIVQWLSSPNPKASDSTYQESGGLGIKTLQTWTMMSSDRLQRYLTFLRNIDVLQWKQCKHTGGAWVLTDRVYNLYLRIMRG